MAARARQDLDDTHRAAATGARGRLWFCRIDMWRLILGGGHWRRPWPCVENFADQRHLDAAVAVGEKAIMPDALEPVGQDVQEETADELGGVERHALGCGSVHVILPGEGDAGLVASDETVVGNSDTVRVAAQVGEHLLGTGERAFGVHYPFDPAQRSE